MEEGALVMESEGFKESASFFSRHALYMALGSTLAFIMYSVFGFFTSSKTDEYY